MAQDRLVVRTADNVELAFATAGIGSRLLALLIDLLIVLVLAAVVEVVLAAALPDQAALAAAVAAGAAFFVFVLYFVILEATQGGRTPGKRALHLRVVRTDGAEADLQAALVRGIIRSLDVGFLGAGALCMFVDPRSRRLGDIAAGTVVIREDRAQSAGPPALPVLLRTPDAGPAIDGLHALGPREAAALRAFLTRPGLQPEQRARIAAQMAATLLDRMALPPAAPERSWPPELFLERLHLQLEAPWGRR